MASTWMSLLIKPSAQGKLKPGYTREELNQVLADKLPPDTEIYIEKTIDKNTKSVKRQPYFSPKEGPDDRRRHKRRGGSHRRL